MQKRLLIVYEEFKKVCEENDLNYFAACGTAIGAVRHNGFIPWDDDMDVFMPLDDYRKFKKIMKSYMSDSFEYRDVAWMGGKFYDKRTTVIDVRVLTVPEKYYGVYIDIFPIFSVPNDESEQNDVVNDVNAFRISATEFEEYPDACPFDRKQIYEWRKRLLDNAKNNTDYLCSLPGFRVKAEGLKKPLMVAFEDTYIPVSSTFDFDLGEEFGSFMELPPVGERKHHDKYQFIDFDKPFKYYQESYESCQEWLKEALDKKYSIEGELTSFKNSLLYNQNILNEKYDAVSNSSDYRIGRMILKPYRFIKSLLRRKKK